MLCWEFPHEKCKQKPLLQLNWQPQNELFDTFDTVLHTFELVIYYTVFGLHICA